MEVLCLLSLMHFYMPFFHPQHVYWTSLLNTFTCFAVIVPHLLYICADYLPNCILQKLDPVNAKMIYQVRRDRVLLLNFVRTSLSSISSRGLSTCGSFANLYLSSLCRVSSYCKSVQQSDQHLYEFREEACRQIGSRFFVASFSIYKF